MTTAKGSMTKRLGRLGGMAVALVALGSVLAACSSSSPQAAPTTTTTDGPVVGPQPAAATTTTVAGKKPATTTTQVSIPLAAITDTGLPSQVGHGPLTSTQVKSLMQYFENHVSAQFANGDANGLQAYLAGTMLTGNKATISVLNGQSRRNIYSIDVTKIIMNANETNRVVFEMKGNMTQDYFENSSTKQPVADELPGPSAVDFLVFLDFNPNNHTWYWTGEQNYNTSDSSGSGSS